MSEAQPTIADGSRRCFGLLRRYRRYVENFAWLISDRAVRLIVGLVVTGMVARYLGREGYGTYHYAVSLMFFLTPFASAGLHQTVMREVLAAPNEAGRWLGTTLVLKLVFGIACTLAVCAYASLFETDETRWLIIIVSINLMLDASSAFDTWFESQTQARFTVWALNAAFLTGAVLKILLIAMGAPLIWFGVVIVIQGAIGLLLKARFFSRAFPDQKRWKWSPELMRPLLRGGLPVVLLTINLVLMKRLDIVMMRGMRGLDETGVYASAAQMSDVLFIVPAVIAATVLPGFMRLREHDPISYRHRIGTYFRLNALFGYLGAIGFAIAVPLVLPLVFSDRFADATPMAQILGLGALPLFLAMSRQDYLFAEGRSASLVWPGVAGLVTNVGLNILLIPRFGGIGAAWATVAAYAVYGVIGSFLHPQTRHAGRMQLAALLTPWPRGAISAAMAPTPAPAPPSSPANDSVEPDDKP